MWRRENVARVEARPEYGGLHIVGVIVQRHCGCVAQLGMRMDRNESTFGASACERHGIHVERALEVFKLMPPQDTPVFDLFEQLLEAELEAVPA